MTELFSFNGVDGASGEYLLPPLEAQILARAARGLPLSAEELRDVRIRRSVDERKKDPYGLIEGLDPTDLGQAGWGVIFPATLEPGQLQALREALRPLLDCRREAAARQRDHRYREFCGQEGYRPGESKADFLKRFGRGAGPADPDKVPYYLLIVGDPETVPFSFQYQLDVQYAVGRLHFEQLEDYYRYACSVAEAEGGKPRLARRAAFWGPANPGDRATRLSAEHLVAPLAGFLAEDQPDWEVQTCLGETAYKRDLNALLHGGAAPALLFTASHGMGFPHGDPRQLPHAGALLSQDWPGPGGHRGRIPEDFYFSADDLAADAGVFGLLAFFFACYGAGTPRTDNFYQTAFMDPRPLAPQAFLARLPQRLLAHPHGGALAVVGHVERAWGYSFYSSGMGRELATFQSTLKRLAEGHPIGSALEYFNQRYAEISTDLTTELQETTPQSQDEIKIARLWTSNNDARNYAVLGDPAVRLMVGAGAAPGEERPSLVIQSLPAASAAAETAEAPAAGFSLVNGELASGEGNRAEDAPPDLAERLAALLAQVLDSTVTLQVDTYTTQDPAGVRFEGGAVHGARLRIRTRLGLDGAAQLILPQGEAGPVDPELWRMHLEVQAQALASRAELLKLALQAAGKTKPDS